jgi:hypothetical protein
VCPLPPVSGGRGTLAGEKGVGRVPIPTRGINCGTLYMYVLCDPRSDFYPSRIPDPATAKKRGGNFVAKLQNILVLFIQKIVTKLSKIWVWDSEKT